MIRVFGFFYFNILLLVVYGGFMKCNFVLGVGFGVIRIFVTLEI